jgi:uncharacterized protein (TIGR03382 family)
MNSRALPDGRWLMPAKRAFVPCFLVSLVALQGCTDAEKQSTTAVQSASALTEKKQAAQEPEYVPGQILVRFRKEATDDKVASIHSQQQAQVLHTYRTISDLQLVQVPEESFSKALEAYSQDPNVLYAEPNYIVHALDNTRAMPNDPRFGELWGLHNTGQSGGTADVDLNMPEAWDITTGSDTVGVITVIDTGVDYNHQDLAANMWTNPGEIAGNNVDDDNNGYVDDVHGINAITGSGNPMDDNQHGSHCAGTIAGRGNNATGVVGVNWNARIMGCKFLSGSGSGTTADAIECVDYVTLMKTRATNPVNIIASSNSWGGGGFSQPLLDAIARNGQAGVLFIAAAGNSSANNDTTPSYPASYNLDHIISVASHTRTDTLSSFSNFGRYTVHVSAPGSDILSTIPNNGYGLLSGTSMATPHVSGLVGLLKAQDPSRDWRALRNLVFAGGVPQTASAGRTVTGRRIRAADTGGRGSLTCDNQVVASREAPMGTTVGVAVGQSLPLKFLHINCGQAAGTPTVTVTPGGSTVAMFDDGANGDQAAGDGLYTGLFEPSAAGTYTLAFPGGDNLTVNVQEAYQLFPTTYAWRTITGTNLNLTDDSMANITSPFPIPFANGTGQTTLRVGMNGGLSFNTTASIGTTNTALPNAGFTTLVSPHWDDLFPNSGAGTSSGNVFWETLGTAPNRELVVEWRNVHHFSARTDGVTFQVVFREGSSDIIFNYQDVSFANATYDRGASATVGVQINSTLATQSSFNTASLDNETALLWSLIPPGSAPEVRAFDVSPATLTEGEDLTVSLEFSDPDGDTDGPWTVQIDTNLTGGFTVDATYQLTTQDPATFTIPMRSSGTDLPVAVRIVDSRRARSTVTTAPTLVTVTDVPPALTAVTAPATVNELQATTLTAAFTDPGADGPWRIEWDFNYDGATFAPDRTTTATTSGDATTSYNFPADGTYTIAARVSDKDGVQTDVVTVQVVVNDLRPTVAALTGEATILEGELLSLTSSFTNPGDNSSPWKVQWDFDYDGTTFDVEAEQTRTSVGNITYEELQMDSGTFTVAVRVVDNDGSVSDVQSLAITVTEVDPIILAFESEQVSSTSTEPVTVSFTVFGFSGSPLGEADEIRQVLWDFDNDGNFDYASFLPFVNHRYTDSPPGGGNTYTARVRLVDEDTYTDQTISITVENAPPTLHTVPMQHVDEGTLVLLQAGATDPGGDALTFSLQNAPAGMSITSAGLIAWRTSYAHGSMAGTPHTATLTVTDDDGATTSQTLTFVVHWMDEDSDGMADTWERSHGLNPSRNDAAEDTNGDGVSNLDEFLSDNGGPVLPDAPALEGAGRVHSSSVELKAHHIASHGSLTTVRYQFQVFADRALTQKVRDLTVDQAATGTTTSVTLTDGTESPELEDLMDDHGYSWRVRATDGSMHGPWSQVHRFTYDPTNDVPTAPANAYPAAGALVADVRPTLSADNASDVDEDALTYTFELAEDAAFTIGVISSGRMSAGSGHTSWAVSQNLKPFGTYHWRVTASDNRGGSTTSTATSFTVSRANREPGAPSLAEPSASATVANRSPTLVANATTDADGDALSYVLEVDTLASFGSPARQASTALSADAQGKVSWQPTTALAENTRYFWRARAADGISASDWTVGSFFVDSTNDAPSAPVALNPSDAVVFKLKPTLTVQNATDPEGDAVTYTFEVRNADGAVVATSSSVAAGANGTTSFTLAEDLQEDAQYTWTARATDARNAQGAASAAASFKVDSAPPPAAPGGCSSVPAGAGSMLPLLAMVAGLLGLRRRQE